MPDDFDLRLRWRTVVCVCVCVCVCLRNPVQMRPKFRCRCWGADEDPRKSQPWLTSCGGQVYSLLLTWTPKVCRIIAFFRYWAIILPTFGGLGTSYGDMNRLQVLSKLLTFMLSSGARIFWHCWFGIVDASSVFLAQEWSSNVCGRTFLHVPCLSLMSCSERVRWWRNIEVHDWIAE